MRVFVLDVECANPAHLVQALCRFQAPFGFEPPLALLGKMARRDGARTGMRAPPLLAFLTAWAAAGSGWEAILWLDSFVGGEASPGAGTGQSGPPLAPAPWEATGPSGHIQSQGAQFETTEEEEHEGEEVAYPGPHTPRSASEDTCMRPPPQM